MKKVLSGFLLTALLLHLLWIPASATGTSPADASLLLESCESLHRWHADFGADLSLNTSQKTQGTSSLNLHPTAPTANAGATYIGVMTYLKFDYAVNMQRYNNFEFDLYLAEDSPSGQAFQVNFATTSADGYNHMIGLDNLSAGWHHFSIDMDSIAPAVPADLSKIYTMRFTWFNYTSFADQSFCLDNLKLTGKVQSDTEYLLQNCDSLTGFTSAFSTTLSLESGIKTQGNSSVKMLPNAPTANTSTTKIGAMSALHLNKAVDTTKYGNLEFDLYLDKASTGAQGFQVNLASSGEDGYNHMVVLNTFTAGWHHITLDIDSIAPAVAVDPTLIQTIRFTWFNYVDQQNQYFLLDDIRLTGGAAPAADNSYMLENCETPIHFTPEFATDLTRDITSKTEGASSLKMVPTAPTANAATTQIGAMAVLNLSNPVNLSNYSYLEFDLYLDKASGGDSQGFQTNLCSTGQDGYNHMIVLNNAAAGWQHIQLAIGSIAPVVATDLTAIKTIRFTYFNYSGKTDQFFRIDNIRLTGPISETGPAPTSNSDVQAVGLERGNIYLIPSSAVFPDSAGRDYDMMRLAVSIQGLVNRGFDRHGVAIALENDTTDGFWLDYIRQDGRTYADMDVVNVNTKEEFLTLFTPFLQQYGIVAWDPAVPATANVAATICGVDSYLPVQYSTAAGSLYQTLIAKNIPVKQSLVGKFSGTAGSTIPETAMTSTGSAKNDAYLWAMEKYMARCNTRMMAYMVDGGPSVPSNPLYNWYESTSGNGCSLPNHDYLIQNRCFFFDLTSYPGEAAGDDPNQPVGTDYNTLKALLQRRYDLSGGQFAMIIGFPPWQIKYTTHSTVCPGSLEAPRLEWHFVETVTSYNCSIEADAANPVWMSNASLYSNYERVIEPQANQPAQNKTYSRLTKYYTIAYTGDYDCSPWLKNRAAVHMGDTTRGQIAVPFNFNVNLIDRIPMVYDYIYENRTSNDYLLAGEGMGYGMLSALYQGFQGKEASPHTRTLPSGDTAYLNYAKPYFKELKMDISTQVINGFSVLEPRSLGVLNQLSPSGSFLQNSAAGTRDIQIYNGVPHLRLFNIEGSDLNSRCAYLYNLQKNSSYNFVPVGFFNQGLNYGTSSSIIEFTTAYQEYYSNKTFGLGRMEYVDPGTFLSLVKQSGQGTVVS